MSRRGRYPAEVRERMLDFSKVRQLFGAEIREIEDGLSSLG
jgi:hypothetical protein